MSAILDSRGNPMHTNGVVERTEKKTLRKHATFLGAGGLRSGTQLDTWLQVLSGAKLPSNIKAQDPFTWHPWVFASAITVATVATSAPFTIFRETEAATDARENRAKRLKRAWRGPVSGSKRRAYQRHVSVPLHKRLHNRELEVDEDHPLSGVLSNPNPHQNGDQLFWTTHLWLSMRGHVMWVLTDDEGLDPVAGERPSRIWPLSAELFEPVLEFGQTGEQVAWKFMPEPYMRRRQQGRQVVLPMTSVIEFKVPHPRNMLQAVSRMAATVDGVEVDLLLEEYNRAIIENDGDPGGIVMHDVPMEPDEQQEWLRKWESRHEGPHAKRRTALLDAGMKYVPTALTPVELQGRENKEWHRSEQSAVMGVPPSQLGVTEFTNYATALGQKKTFWDNTLLPQTKLVDRTLDATLFALDPDDIVGMHDLRDVDALRSGMTEKIMAAKELCGPELHSTPRVAYETVGLQVGEYELDNEALVPATLTTLDELSVVLPEEEPAPALPLAPEDEPAPAGEDEPVDESLMIARTAVEQLEKEYKQLAGRRWRAFVRVQGPLEVQMRARYLRWAMAEQRLTLARFDEVVRGATAQFEKQQEPATVNLQQVLPNPSASETALRIRVRPLFLNMMDETWKFTLADLGSVPVFEIDDPRIMRVFEVREAKMVTSVPDTVRKNLARSLTTGINQGETIDLLRKRVKEVYGVATSQAKALSIARTETGGFMNTMRRVMFDAQGFTENEWITAGDANVRPDHVTFGKAGPQEAGFNYMSLIGGGGTLRYPHDPEGPVGQVVSCRCLEVPVS